MTREIKFRAWDKVQHKLMNVVEMDWEPHGTDEHGNFKREIYYVRAQNIKDFADVEGYCGRAEIEELMFEQYTGLHDDNDKEIYEGDIVTGVALNNFGFNGVIKFRRGGLYVSYFIDTTRLYNLEEYELRIVGNIHENPELLEETKK